MPEGDTIHNAAARLRPALEGKAVVRFEANRVAASKPRPGALITTVEAMGKHLLVHFDDGHVLRTHLRMTGRWDVYAPGQRWRKPAYLARAVIEVDGAVAVCFSAPVVEVTRERRPPAPAGMDPRATFGGTTGHLARPATAVPRGVAHLGPDLCRPEADLDEALARMARIPEPDTAIEEVLLDQRVAAGVGNVYKSEVLWACRVHPFVPLSQVDEDTRRRLLDTAARQLRANLHTGTRQTVSGPPGSVAAYRRARRPCRRCGTPIEWRRTGALNRSTYWCPTCQPDPDPGA